MAVRRIEVRERVMARNDELAAVVRERLAQHSVTAFNLVGEGLRDAMDPRLRQ